MTTEAGEFGGLMVELWEDIAIHIDAIETVADGLWWSAVTMTTVGYGDKVPRSRIGKFLSPNGNRQFI